MLGDADAEDAFQATFLALIRFASRIRKGTALSSWLYGVAVRVSLSARREAGRRRNRERAAAASKAIPPSEPDDWADTMAAVHREVAALPDADRSAFVLCVMEGLTQAEAATRLGQTPGAIAGQVARAKKRLAARLPAELVAKFIAWKQSVWARVISLILENRPGDLAAVADECHQVRTLDAGEVAIGRVLSV